MMDLSDREKELITLALYERAEALYSYLRWVDDKPTLPAREVAIGRIAEEVIEYKKLAYYFKFGNRPGDSF